MKNSEQIKKQEMEMLAAFQVFTTEKHADFMRISRATGNELSAGELKSEAWILGQKLGEKRQREIDFSDHHDQQQILGTLYIVHVKQPGKSVRYAVSIDQFHDSNEGERNPWENRLTAQETADPVVSLIRSASNINEAALLTNSYSQATAYVMVFVYFKNDSHKVSTYLLIARSTLAGRVQRAADSVRMQASLFDGIERIASNFMPSRGRTYSMKNIDPAIAVHPQIANSNYALFI